MDTRSLLGVVLVILAITAGATPARSAPSTAPEPRDGEAIAYDSARGRVVLFGGERKRGGDGDAAADGTETYLNDTLEWDGSSWTVRASEGPSPRRAHAMAYDSALKLVVLFGGYDGGALADTWVWDGTAWAQRGGAGPSPRRSLAMAYDAARDRLVLFGGDDGEGRVLGDTWEWDGMVWTQRAGAGPSPRRAHAMTYDAARRRVVLFGGNGGSAPLTDTWEWDGAKWTPRPSPEPSPPTSETFAVCDDYDVCTTDTYQSATGQCWHTPVSCDDGNPCTDDSCRHGFGCVHAPDDTNSCQGSDRCARQICVAGFCQTAWTNCDDGDPCTVDACNAATGACSNRICDDGNGCSTDTCTNGTCSHTTITSGFCPPPTCYQDAYCTAQRICQRNYPWYCPPPISCYNRVCQNNTCVTVPPSCVSNPNPCIQYDQCCGIQGHNNGGSYPGQNACYRGTCSNGFLTQVPVTCNDNDPCTRDDCNTATGCVFLPVCDDGNPCTVDTCDATGQCSHSAPLDCDDADPCTVDSCNGTQCTHGSLPVEVGGLDVGLFGLSWSTAAHDGVTVYQVLSGAVPGLPVGQAANQETCLGTTTAPPMPDSTVPQIGGALFYLVRAQRPDCAGSYGREGIRGTPAAERVTGTCP